MATTQFLSSNPLKQETDIDMNSFIDFSGGESYPSPKQDSFFPRPTLEASELPDSEDFQSFSGPSHEYERYQQQTGLPPAALTHLHAFIDEESQTLSQSSSSASGSFEIPTTAFNEETSFDSFLGDTMDGFAYDDQNVPNAQSHINHDAMQRAQPRRSLQEASYRPDAQPRLSVPTHNQYPNLQRAQSVTTPQTLHPQQTLQPSPVTSQPASQQSFDPHINVDETIHRVLAKIRHDSVQSGNLQEDAGSPGSSTPHLARAKKDEEEMDADEKLLASEEGKALSSKERRQLRNKVSARAFRHRRKEYITQLEDEIKSKNNALDGAVNENHKLRKENEQMSNFIKELLSKPAFRGTLEDLASPERTAHSRNSSMAPPPRRTPSSQLMAPNTPTNMPNFGMATSPIGLQGPSQQFPQTPQSSMQLPRSSGQDFDIAALGALNLQGAGDQWGTASGSSNSSTNQWNNDPMAFDFNTSINNFVVLDLPQGPSLEQLKSEALSGKGSEPILPTIDTEQYSKPDYPTIREVMPTFTQKADAPTSLPVVSEPGSDDHDFDLFSDIPAAASHQTVCAGALSGKYRLLVLPPSKPFMAPEERLERMCQVLDASVDRLENLM
ncbi:MAG: hypothetical protein Q9165_000210 [Trypethelium subeluteriae]